MLASNLYSLLDIFQNSLNDAFHINTGDPSDSIEVKLAVAGFGIGDSYDSWRIDHLKFILDYLDTLRSESRLEDYGSTGNNIAMFSAFAMGYLLGLFQAGKIDEVEFQRGEILLPGVIMEKLPQILSPDFTNLN